MIAKDITKRLVEAIIKSATRENREEIWCIHCREVLGGHFWVGPANHKEDCIVLVAKQLLQELNLPKN